jgi:hypothetical protein
MATKPSTSKQEQAQIARGGTKPKTDSKPPTGNKGGSGGSTGGLSARQREAIKGLGGLTESLGGLAELVGKLGSTDTGGGAIGARTDASYVAEGRSGTSNTGKNYINGVLATPEEWSTFLYGDKKTGNLDDDSETKLLQEEKREKRQSIYDTVTSELTRLGLSSLIGPLKTLFESGISDGESLRLALSQTPEYQTRFSANAKRIAAGLSALSPAEYIQLEDQYQNVMRNYGLPSSYYAKDATGKQIGFDELLGGDVSSTELEERLITAQDRVLKSNPEVLNALKTFYPGIGNGDILAYSLDPKNALKDIQRKVAAAEIGGAALAQGLATSATGAEELAGLGVTKDQAQQGFINVAQMAPRGGVLSEIYNEAPYNQATATAEVFGTAGAAEAAQKRRKLTALEEATFSGQSGLGQGALARNGGGGAF